MKKVTKAVIPVAGFGTRFLPATKGVAKEMFPIVNIPALQHIVNEAVESGIKDILIILSRGKDIIPNYFDLNPELEAQLLKSGKKKQVEQLRKINEAVNIQYVRQPEMKGSGAVILLAESFTGNEPFAVMFGDDVIYSPKKPVVGQLIKAYEKTGTCILGAQTREPEEAIKYGAVIPGKVDGRLTEMLGIIEKPTIDKLPSNLVSLGRFILTSDIYKYIRKTKPAKNGEVYLTDALGVLLKDKGCYAYDFEGRRYDIGDKFGYVEATIEYALRDKDISDRLKKYLKELKF